MKAFLLISVLLFWSFSAWVVYALAGASAGIIAAVFAALLPAGLDGATTWLITSLGNIMQAIVAVAWAIVAIIIVSRFRLGRA